MISHAARLLLFFAAFSVVLGGHLWLVDTASSPVPVHDQWQAEAEFVLLPSLNHQLTTERFLLPHAEHRIAPTRLLALGLFKANDERWDVRLQMTVNAVLCGLFAVTIGAAASRVLGGFPLIGFAGVFSTLLASPLFYGNALWGFQSQFYFLLLFSVLHLLWTTQQPVGSPAWIAGVACSGLACVSMGSGFASALVMTIVTAIQLARKDRPESRARTAISCTIHGAIVLVAISAAPVTPHGPANWPDILHTFIHCLSWPFPYFHRWGAWVWIPWLTFAVVVLFRRATASDWLVFALGAWALGQIAGIGWARSTPSIVITPRYYELLFVGLVANALGTVKLYRVGAALSPSTALRTVFLLLGIGWYATVLLQAARFADSHRRMDLASYRTFATSQVEHVRRFLATDDVKVLTEVPYPMVPHPEPDYLARLLRDPRVRAMLPTELNDVPSPRAARLAAALRGTGRWWALASLVSLLVAIVALLRTPRTSPPAPISR